MGFGVYFMLFVAKSGYSPTDEQLAKLGSILERNGFIRGRLPLTHDQVSQWMAADPFDLFGEGVRFKAGAELALDVARKCGYATEDDSTDTVANAVHEGKYYVPGCIAGGPGAGPGGAIPIVENKVWTVLGNRLGYVDISDKLVLYWEESGGARDEDVVRKGLVKFLGPYVDMINDMYDETGLTVRPGIGWGA
ncbi:MAG: hypothetical protein ACTSUE_22095 [Promethearchaeota archaeon]